jgi:hypothetical protein
MARQGPHQAAQKSTNNGRSLLLCLLFEAGQVVQLDRAAFKQRSVVRAAFSGLVQPLAWHAVDGVAMWPNDVNGP